MPFAIQALTNLRMKLIADRDQAKLRIQMAVQTIENGDPEPMNDLENLLDDFARSQVKIDALAALWSTQGSVPAPSNERPPATNGEVSEAIPGQEG